MSKKSDGITEKETHGFILEIQEGRIISIREKYDIQPRKIYLGQNIISNGRIESQGLRGVVEKIFEPFTRGKTGDVIFIKWEHGDVSSMKFKDLFFDFCRCKYCVKTKSALAATTD